MIYGESKCTETDLKNVPDLSHLGPIWPYLDAKFDIRDEDGRWYCLEEDYFPYLANELQRRKTGVCKMN